LRVAVLALGNVLQGDDGAGATVAARLLASFDFEPEIRIEDLGTPGLHLHPLLADLDAVVLVDTVMAEAPAGTVRVYRRDDLLKGPMAPRVSPHDPGLMETLQTLDFSGSAPKEVCVVGVVPQDTSQGVELTPAVESALAEAESEIIQELERLGVVVTPSQRPVAPDLWWKRA